MLLSTSICSYIKKKNFESLFTCMSLLKMLELNYSNYFPLLTLEKKKPGRSLKELIKEGDAVER